MPENVKKMDTTHVKNKTVNSNVNIKIDNIPDRMLMQTRNDVLSNRFPQNNRPPALKIDAIEPTNAKK
ncbi:hypothetical protein BLOT_016017 [Blomia tropicalis]|nr:hypothetical protein BLOT_016017 [Blomia tropicalis]